MTNTIAFQRLEGLAIFVAATFLYFDNGLSWILYFALFFTFDVSILGYLVSTRAGAYCYNFVHSLVTPSVLTIIYVMNPSDTLLGLTCLWFAHIGFDRAMGFGLKYNSGFKHTTLGDIGK